MTKSLLRNTWLALLLAGAFILLDLLVDRLGGVRSGIDPAHVLLIGAVLLVSFVVARRAAETQRRAEAALRASRDELEVRVRERVAELESVDAALRQVNERLELTQAASGAGFWDWDLASGRIEWSPRMFELFGLEMGTTAASLDAWRSVLHPEDREAMERQIDLALETHSDLASEYRIIRPDPDGEVRWISALGKGTYDEQSRAYRMSGLCLDITDRKLADLRIEHLASFPEMNPNPVLEFDASGKMAYRNPASALALERGGLEDDARAFLPDDLPAILQALRRQEESAFRREVQVGSSTFSETVHVIPALDVLRVYAFETTDRVRAEEALRLSEEKYRLLFHNMAEGFALYELLYDEQGSPVDWRVLEVNDAYTRHTAVARDLIVGQRASKLFPDAIPEYLPRFAEVVATQVPVVFETYAKRAGRHQRVFTFPAGSHRFASTIEDITDRRQAAEALRASEEKFGAVFRSSPTGLAIARTRDGTFVDVNLAFARALGYEPSELIGKRVGEVDLIVSGDAQKRAVQLVLEEGRVVDHELEFRAKNGEIATMLASLATIRVSDEPCVLAVAHDITERIRYQRALRRAEAALALADREKAILEQRQHLARDLHDSVAQALYSISLGAHTALALLDGDRDGAVEALDYVISMARVGMDEMRAVVFELRPESLEMEGLVAALNRQMVALHARHGIDIGSSLCDEPAAELAVKEALYRIAQEALQNAIKHARSDRLEVCLTCEPDGVRLEISDNGIGFDPQAFFPGHLGLQSMRERAEGVGGSLEILSEPDGGTRVCVSVPIPTPETAQAE